MKELPKETKPVPEKLKPNPNSKVEHQIDYAINTANTSVFIDEEIAQYYVDIFPEDDKKPLVIMDLKIFSNKFYDKIERTGKRKNLGYLIFNDVKNPKKFRDILRKWIHEEDINLPNNPTISEGVNEISEKLIEPAERKILTGLSSYGSEHNYNIMIDGLSFKIDSKPREKILKLSEMLEGNCGTIIVNRKDPIKSL